MNHPQGMAPRPAARGCRLTALGAALLLALATLVTPPRAQGAEFSVPPGPNPAAQEELLKNRVSALARDMVGDKLVDVIAHVGYVRADLRTSKGPDDRVKLPGFNSFIDASGQGDKVVPEFSRVRQIFVIVEEDPTLDRTALEGDLKRQGNFNAADGDWLEVVLVRRPPAASEQAAPTTPQTGNADTEAGPALGPKLPREPLREPQSTAYLLRARTHYFAGDYHKALDQILQAIRIKPDNSQAYIMLGSIYYTMNWKSLALKYWEIALSLDPENAEVSDLITQIRAAP